jgi:uncharacterized protein
MKEIQFDVLRERLSKLIWPAGYMFKFIVPADKVGEIVNILPEVEYTLKESGKGNYVSVTSFFELSSEDEVIAIYQKAAQVKGVISL